MKDQDQKKKMLWGGVALAVIVVLVGVYLAIKGSGKPPSKTEQPLQNEAPLPAIDSSVKVDLTAAPGKKEVILSIENIPSQTSSIDYELSYQTVGQGLQGVIGTIHLDNGESSYKKTITLGTCSSGSCVYHDVIGNISLSLKFSGANGQKIFQKDFPI